MFRDFSKPMEGYFSIKIINADGTYDLYEEHNKIMDSGRVNMAKIMSSTESFSINYLKIGNRGTESGSNTVPLDFSTTRTKLFSEVDSDATWLRFELPVLTNGDETSSFSKKGLFKDTDEDTGDDAENTTITTTVENNKVTFKVSLPIKAGVPSGDTLISYEEAALYIGDEIFSMKTFPARVKDYNVSFEISWSITF